MVSGNKIQAEEALDKVKDGASNLTGQQKLVYQTESYINVFEKKAPAKEAEEHYKLSPRRWAILGAMCLFGYTNGLTNDLFAILHTLIELLGYPIEDYLYIWQIFFYIVPIMGLPTAWFVDRYGYRASIITILAMAIGRNLFRSLFFLPHLPLWASLKLLYWIICNLLMQQVMLGFYCLPLKISESWFSKRERAIAWTLINVCPVLGSATSSLTTPRYIHGTGDVYKLAYLNLTCIPVVSLAIFLCITRSKPKYFPSLRAKLNEESYGGDPIEGASSSDVNGGFLENIKRLAKEWNVLIQIVVIAVFDMFIMTINAVLQDILSASGFDQITTGQFMATMTIASSVLQTMSSFLVVPAEDDAGGSRIKNAGEESEAQRKNRKIVRKCKLYMVLICITFLIYSGSLTLRDYPQHQWRIAISAALLYTVLRFWAAPAYNDLMAYLISGSVTQATVGALQMITQSVLSVLFAIAIVYFRQTDNQDIDGQRPPPETMTNNDNSTSATYERPNYTNSIIFMAIVAVSATLFYLFAFDGRKRAMRGEERCNLNGSEKASNLELGDVNLKRLSGEKRSRANTLPMTFSKPNPSAIVNPSPYEANP